MIFANDGLGINLGYDGVTPNDPGDADGGGNNLQNYPILTVANADANGLNVQGTLNSTPNTPFDIVLYSNEECDPTGFGEGRTFLRTFPVTTNAGGDATFNTQLFAVPTTRLITATATNRSDNSTSEFSRCLAITSSSRSVHLRWRIIRLTKMPA